MAGSLNKVFLIGHLGKDPETRYMADGGAVTSFSIATSEQWKDKSGEKQEKTEWHRLVSFGKLAEIAGEYLKKGSLVHIEGKLQTRKWQDKDGNDRYSTEIVVGGLQMLGRPAGSGAGGSSRGSDDREATGDHENGSGAAPRKPATPAGVAGTSKFDDFEDDIPF